MRRRWSHSLVSWTRLLAGGFRDPLVGRDLLFGFVWITALTCLQNAVFPLSSLLGCPTDPPYQNIRALKFSGLGMLDLVIANQGFNVLFGLGTLFLLFLFRVLLKRQWAAVTAFLLITTAISVALMESPVAVAVSVLYWACMLLVLARYGLVALIAGLQFGMVFRTSPITTQMSAWYSATGMTMLAVLIGVTVFAFYTSLGGRPVLGQASLGD